jgi:hypothetical protein
LSSSSVWSLMLLRSSLNSLSNISFTLLISS